MPFGLTNAPATFQSLMNSIFKPYLRKFILVFFDDILVYSNDYASHMEHLRITLQTLQNHALFAKKSKCLFATEEVQYLGHIIAKDGVAADKAKIQSMLDWAVPTNIKGLGGFFGLTGYYRKFIQHYGLMSIPLSKWLKKDKFSWNDKAETTFKELKMAMVNAPVLTMPDFTIPFIIETDVCHNGLGAVLMQRGKSIAYLSKAIAPKHLGFSTYEKELLAVVYAVTKWRHYILGHKVFIKTDH